MDELNCATHMSRQPCVVQLSFAYAVRSGTKYRNLERTINSSVRRGAQAAVTKREVPVIMMHGCHHSGEWITAMGMVSVCLILCAPCLMFWHEMCMLFLFLSHEPPSQDRPSHLSRAALDRTGQHNSALCFGPSLLCGACVRRKCEWKLFVFSHCESRCAPPDFSFSRAPLPLWPPVRARALVLVPATSSSNSSRASAKTRTSPIWSRASSGSSPPSSTSTATSCVPLVPSSQSPRAPPRPLDPTIPPRLFPFLANTTVRLQPSFSATPAVLLGGRSLSHVAQDARTPSREHRRARRVCVRSRASAVRGEQHRTHVLPVTCVLARVWAGEAQGGAQCEACFGVDPNRNWDECVHRDARRQHARALAQRPVAGACC